MAKQSALGEYLKELLQDWSAVRYRGMFGGFGLYREDLMFGLIADEVLFLKGDKQSLSTYEAHECDAFCYEKNGKSFAMSYYRCPEEAMDDSEVMQQWAQLAWEAALRQKK